MTCSMVFQPSLSMSGLLGGVKATIRKDSGSSVLKLVTKPLQQFSLSRVAGTLGIVRRGLSLAHTMSLGR